MDNRKFVGMDVHQATISVAVGRGRKSQGFWRLWLCRAPVYPPGGGITPVPLAPTRLRFPPAIGLTFRPATGPLPVSYSRIRPEPPAADGAWSLPGLWHRDDSSLSSRFDSLDGARSKCLGQF